MSERVALVTDSTCDIPDTLLEQYNIAVVPCIIIFGDEALRDRVDLQADEFYRRLASGPHYPTTAQPTPVDFLAVYRAAQARGAQEIVVITVSSAMSGTMAMARQAAEMIDLPVHVVDSRGPTMTTGWQVLAAARAREAGGDAQAMLAAAAAARETMVQVVALDTMEYLHKGGRIGGATAFLGAVLQIKPLVVINHLTGLVEAGERIRTHKRAVEALYQTFFRLLGNSYRALRVAVLHGNALQDAELLAERICREFSPTELLVAVTSPVLGVHTGPGALALCGYVER
jgi:DegV family protein with EDD domain